MVLSDDRSPSTFIRARREFLPLQSQCEEYDGPPICDPHMNGQVLRNEHQSNSARVGKHVPRNVPRDALVLRV